MSVADEGLRVSTHVGTEMETMGYAVVVPMGGSVVVGGMSLRDVMMMMMMTTMMARCD